MHKREDGVVCFDGGEEEVERRLFEEALRPATGVRYLVRAFLSEFHDLRVESWEGWQRVIRMGREQGFFGADDGVDYDYVQRGFRVRPRISSETKERLAFLDAEKRRAVEEKDYEGAADLRDYADRLRAKLQAGETAGPEAGGPDVMRDRETSPAGSDDATA